MRSQPIFDIGSLKKYLSRSYPSGVFRRFGADPLDVDLEPARFDALIDEIARVTNLNAVVEADGAKSHTLRVGLSNAPDWEVLNRGMGKADRIALLSRRKGGVLYWNVILSRIAPLWTGHWNRFEVVGGEVLPRLVEASREEAWQHLCSDVSGILSRFGLFEVDRSLVRSQLPWLRESMDPASPNLSVFDAFFSDL